MVIATLAIMAFFMLGLSKKSIIPNRFQIMCELSYEFIANLLRTNVGDQGKAFFPFVFSLFMFIFFKSLCVYVTFNIYKTLFIKDLSVVVKMKSLSFKKLCLSNANPNSFSKTFGNP